MTFCDIVTELNLSDSLDDSNENFHVKKYYYNNNEYTIIKYNKEKLKIIEIINY